MNTFRVLLVENDPIESERITDRLEKANHAVLPTGGLDEAAQALEIQRFDAVILTSKVVTDELLSFRKSLTKLEQVAKSPIRIPVLCYASTPADEPTAAQLSRYQVDGCLPQDFEALAFSQLVSSLASGISAGNLSNNAGDTEGSTLSLPVFNADEFQEQVGYDRDLVVEILDLFLADSLTQVEAMRNALTSGELLTLSRVAHSIKGSLGSLYAMQAASRAQTLEHVAKAGDATSATVAFALLETDLQALKPELLSLRNAESGS